MNFTALVSWFRAPTTIAGLSTMVGTGFAVLSGSVTLYAAFPVLVGSLVAVIIPDNTQAKTTAQALATDVETFASLVVPKTTIPVASVVIPQTTIAATGTISAS